MLKYGLNEAPITDRDYLVEQINSGESGCQVKITSFVHENDSGFSTTY